MIQRVALENSARERWTRSGSSSLRGMKQFLLVPAIALLAACGGGQASTDGGHTSADSTSVDTAHTAAAIDLGKYDMPLMLNAPDKQYTGGAEPSIMWKDEVGKLAIKAGDHFSLTVMEDPGDMARLKGDLDRDMLKKNVVVQETPELLIYRSEFPDDKDLVFVHFYKVIRVGERSFVVTDADDNARFTEQDVQQMAAAITPKQPA